MLRKVFVVLCMAALLIFSFTLLKKTESKKVAVEDTQETVYEEEKLPDTTYTFNVEKLPEACEETDEVFCAVEKAVKCTIKTDLPFCAALDLPKFIFMTDPSIERPTEISYKFINKFCRTIQLKFIPTALVTAVGSAYAKAQLSMF